MAKYDEFRTSNPRQERTINAACFAAPEMFEPNYEDVPKSLQDAFREGLSIPCEGGGIPGQWCAKCEFGEVEEEVY